MGVRFSVGDFSSGTALRGLAVLVSAFLLACSFPLPAALSSMEGSSAAWMGLIPLILVARLSRPKAAFGWGWLCGWLFWLISLLWILELRHTWGYLTVVIVAWMALAAYCALYMGLFAFCMAVVWPDTGSGSRYWREVGLTLLAAVLWVGCEYWRAVLFTGFPWNMLGVSQYRNIAAIQVASWGGVYAVSGVIALLNAALALTALRIGREVRRRGRRRRVHVALMVGLTGVALCWAWGVRTVRRGHATVAKDHIRVAAIQPNLPQEKKWSEAHRQDAYDVLKSQTELALTSSPHLIIWPETAIPDLFRTSALAQSIVGELAASQGWLLVGSMDMERFGDEVRFFNAGILVGPARSITAVYRKRHLVPFGEYIPFENRLPFVKRLAPMGFSCRPGPDMGIIELPVGGEGMGHTASLGVLICFEDVFSYLARRDVQAGARVLVNQTNDAWFGPSAAPRQHMANAVFRAVENRVPLVRCANTGMTCFVDRFGRIVEWLVDDEGNAAMKGFSVADVSLWPSDCPQTLYTQFGDWMLAKPCAMVVGIVLWFVGIRRLLRHRCR